MKKNLLAALVAAFLICIGSQAQAPTSSLWVMGGASLGAYPKLLSFSGGIPVFAPGGLSDDGTNLFYGGFKVPSLTVNPTSDGCAFFASGRLSSTGTACGAGSGGAVFPSTPGLVWNTSTTASQNATPANVASLKLGNAALGINHVTYNLLNTGDSYASAQGATQLGLGYSYLMAQDIPAMTPTLQKGVPGSFMPQIGGVTLLNWIPSATNPSVLLTNGGNNDYTADTCSHAASSNCITNFQQAASANAMWAAIPLQQRLCASSGATATGTWTASVTVPFSTYNCSTVTSGTALASSVSGSTLTFTVPNTNNGYVGVNQATANANTGTYTISIGGVLQMNPCTSTTVFSSGPCGGTAMDFTPGMQRNQFFNAAWAGQATSVVITTTNAAATAIAAVDYAVTTWPANTSSVWVANSGAAFDVTGVYSAAAAATVAQLRATGANVFLVDIRAALLAIAGGGISTSPTSDCPVGSTSSGHPSNCGQMAEYRAFVASESANNYVFSSAQIGGTTGTNQGNIFGPLNVSPQFANVATGATPIIAHNLNATTISSLLLKMQDTSGVGTGLHLNGLGTTMPDGATNQIYESLWGSFSAGGPAYACFEPAPAFTGSILANTVWAPTACVNFLTGAFTTKGSFTNTPEVVTFSATPTFSATIGLSQIILTGNVTSSTLAAGTSGEQKTFQVCQDSAGSHAFTWPTNVKGGMTVGSTLSSCSVQTFTYSTLSGAVGWYATSPGMSNM